jgi:hypothetical protein
VRIPRKQQDIALPVVISLIVEMLDIFAQRPAQRALTEENYLGQALSFTDRTQRSAWHSNSGYFAGTVASFFTWSIDESTNTHVTSIEGNLIIER